MISKSEICWLSRGEKHWKIMVCYISSFHLSKITIVEVANFPKCKVRPKFVIFQCNKSDSSPNQWTGAPLRCRFDKVLWYVLRIASSSAIFCGFSCQWSWINVSAERVLALMMKASLKQLAILRTSTNVIIWKVSKKLKSRKTKCMLKGEYLLIKRFLSKYLKYRSIR